MQRVDCTTATSTHLKSSNTGVNDHFGYSSSLNDNGKELAIGTQSEASQSGAVYVYKN